MGERGPRDDQQTDTPQTLFAEGPDEAETTRSDVAYRVLARKYRPTDFSQLIGQDILVRTLSNGFTANRIAQAYMLTGVRGVGKTTTARIIARALNYEIPGEVEQPSLALDRLGIHCAAILGSRHVDVIEMDAASHTGIADIREIIDSVAYRPISARYKVYIIDEVHMLSTQAFNGLLKTLEEPPDHVKFIFATTEIRKVPVTILSRCQRFDLRRVEADTLLNHLTWVCTQERVDAEPAALAIIARASEGSVRDGLSMLDQAIAYGGGRVEGQAVREMIGLADHSHIVALFDYLMRGKVADLLSLTRTLYSAGGDANLILAELARHVHFITRLHYLPEARDDPTLTEAERNSAMTAVNELDIRLLARAWQGLINGLGEVEAAPDPWHAGEMILVRLAHMADLPTPDDLLRWAQTEAAPDIASASEPTIAAGASAHHPGDRPVNNADSRRRPDSQRVETAPTSVTRPAAEETPSDAARDMPSDATRDMPSDAGQHVAGSSEIAGSRESDSPQPGARPHKTPLGPADNAPARHDAPDHAVTDWPARMQDNHQTIANPGHSSPEPREPTEAHTTGDYDAGPSSFQQLAELATRKRDPRMAIAIERYIRPVAMGKDWLEIGLTDEAPSSFLRDLGQRLLAWTGRRWLITLSNTAESPSLIEQKTQQQHRLQQRAANDPLVQEILTSFPDSEIGEITPAKEGHPKAARGQKQEP